MHDPSRYNTYCISSIVLSKATQFSDDPASTFYATNIAWQDHRAQNLKQGNILKTSFKTWVSRMGLGRVVNINIFVMKYYFIQFVYILNFFSNLLNQNLQSVKTPKRKLGSFVQRYSFKFRAQTVKFLVILRT